MNEIQDFFDRLAPNWDKGNQKPGDDVAGLIKRLGIKKGDAVLDLACGRGVITGLLSAYSQNQVLGMDLSPKMIEGAKEDYAGAPGAAFVCEDFLSSNHPGEFDYVVVFNAYPHFVDRAKFKTKLYDSLKEGGKFAIVHSFGAAGLNRHHEGVAPTVSRTIGKSEEEAAFFADCFDIVLAEDDAKHYLIIGRKK